VKAVTGQTSRPRPLPVGSPERHSRLAINWELPSVVALLALAVLVRRPDRLLTYSFWADEGWVADSVRAPLEQLPLVTSSTPLGWTLLLRVVPPVGGPNYLRLLPLAFAVAAVLPAWALGRELGRALGRAVPVYALVAGAAIALFPGRHSLKQYSAEACLALVLLLAAARLEAAWSRARLAVLAGACILAFPFANTTPFVTAGVFGGLALATAARRAWRRLAELAVAGVAVALAQGAWYLRVASGGDIPAMRAYWERRYIPTDEGAGAAAGFVADRFQVALDTLGLGPWWLAAALLALGLVALYRAGLGGVALAVPLVAAGVVAAAALHRYPLLEKRTSMFVFAIWVAVAALGLAFLAAELLRWWPLGVVAVALVAGFLVTEAQLVARINPPEDVQGVVGHILAWRQPGDTVVVSSLDAYPFAWYWPDQPTFVPTRASSTITFQVTYPKGEVVVARWRDAASVEDALEQLGPGPRCVWLVAEHVPRHERSLWLAGLAERGATISRPLRGLVQACLPAGRP
jgi:hypothetical protein